MYCYVHWTYLGGHLQKFLRHSESMLETEAQQMYALPGSLLKDELACQAYCKQKCTVLQTYLASSPSAGLAVQEFWKLPPDVCGMHWSAQCALWPWHLQFYSMVQYPSGNLWPMAAETRNYKG